MINLNVDRTLKIHGGDRQCFCKLDGKISRFRALKMYWLFAFLRMMMVSALNSGKNTTMEVFGGIVNGRWTSDSEVW